MSCHETADDHEDRVKFNFKFIHNTESVPMWRMTLSAVDRNLKYSRFDKVWEGATTIESPVWTPNGSKFSMLQTVMQLSRTSRTTCVAAVSRGAGVLRRSHFLNTTRLHLWSNFESLEGASERARARDTRTLLGS